MIRTFLSSILLLSCTFSFSQTFKNDSVKAFVDKSIDLIRLNAVDTSNMIPIQKIFYSKAKDYNSVSELPPLYSEIFMLLNDHHGSLKYKGKTYGWNKPAISKNAYLKDKLKFDKAVVSQIIDRRMGYIRIPGNNDFAFKQVDSIANDITAHINKINSTKIKAWIIDLRTNTGGNMYPILLGLKEFIGSENIIFGGFRNSKNESSGRWEIKNGKMLIDDIELARKVRIERRIRKDVPIVILTSCYTASAGEMTAISLIGRKNTFVVGEPTAGYTTAVQGFTINDYAGLNLATDYVHDRNLKVYKNQILPDIEVLQGDNIEDFRNDTKIIEARKLIKK